MMNTHFLSKDKKNIDEYQSDGLGRTGWNFSKFHISFRDLMSPKKCCGVHKNGENTSRMTMCLTGKLRICLTGVDSDKDFFVVAGSCCLQYYPGHCPCLNCGCGHQAKVLEMLCPADELVKLVGGTVVGRQLEQAINERRPLHIRQSMSPRIHQALVSLNQASEERGSGFAPLVLARTLEMVWLFTRFWEPMESWALTGEISQALEKARLILESNLSDPPDLETLAAKVGMSLSKLKQEFPRVFGLPPYAYLRRVRMERAMELLTRNEMSVTEAALEVGYSSLSHFAKSFTGFHGIKPSRVAFQKGFCPMVDKSDFNW